MGDEQVGDEHLAEIWFEQASEAFRIGRFDVAAAAAQIASAAVFLQDADQVAAQAAKEAVDGLERTTRAAGVAIDRMATAIRILHEAAQTGPRHPAIHAALDALTGNQDGDEDEPRQPG